MKGNKATHTIFMQEQCDELLLQGLSKTSGRKNLKSRYIGGKVLQLTFRKAI